MIKHHCPRLPRTSQIEYDWQWKWCWTTNQVMENVDYCPYCGAKLTEPTVKHIEMLGSYMDTFGNIVLHKDKSYKVIVDAEEFYTVVDENNGFILVKVYKKQRGILYKCKEVL